jgi:hypothetical protein
MGSTVRDSTSTERTWRAKGFGYRRKKARRGVGGESGLKESAGSKVEPTHYS